MQGQEKDEKITNLQDENKFEFEHWGGDYFSSPFYIKGRNISRLILSTPKTYPFAIASRMSAVDVTGSKHKLPDAIDYPTESRRYNIFDIIPTHFTDQDDKVEHVLLNNFFLSFSWPTKDLSADSNGPTKRFAAKVQHTNYDAPDNHTDTHRNM